MRATPLDSSHTAAALAVVQRAIRQTEGNEYSAQQVGAWLCGMTERRFRVMLDATTAVGVFEGDRLLGLATFLDDREELDFLYVDPDAWRRGVGRRLIAAIEHHAQSIGAAQIRVDASLLARPMLERLGYCVVEEYRKEIRGATFDNAWLVKTL